MKNLKLLGTLLLLVFTMSVFTGCSKDDDDDEVKDVASYILGTWHSYKFTASLAGETVEQEITKTGAYSQLYYELTFNNDNTAIYSGYQQDENNLSKWQTEKINYSVSGNVIKLYDNTGSIELMFDSNSRKLYLRSAGEVDGQYITTFVYLTK